jgi:hypothetical protein
LLLQSLSQALMELTIRNRYYYDSPDALVRLREGNEAIHRLNGHLRDLLDPAEELTESRKDGIMEQLLLLPPPVLDRIFPSQT